VTDGQVTSGGSPRLGARAPGARPEADGTPIGSAAASAAQGKPAFSRSFLATTGGTKSSMLVPKRTSSFSRDELT